MSARHRLRAPRDDGAILAEPPLADTGRLLHDNRRRLAKPVAILGRSLADLRAAASHDTIAAASDYLRQAGEPIPSITSTSLLVAGHQPELVHPGVWVKHFALHGLAKQHGLTPLNLIVDHDTMKSASIRLPARQDGLVNLAAVPFDTWTAEAAYEERPVLDEALFASFPDRAGAILSDWGLTPLLADFWKGMGDTTKLLGERLAAGRRAVERRWGCHNLELPTSKLCQTPAFAWFAAHLLLNIDRFIDIHNAALAEYRRANGIRSRNHPVPDLARAGDWCETPLWGWRIGQQRRGRLFARPTAGGIELRSGDDHWGVLPDRPADLINAWPTLEDQGRKVRFRALTTTIFARLLLADAFVHGIGGGKYDELSDVIIERFYGIEPPEYLILSATLHLPLPAEPVERGARAELIQQVRHVHFHPDRHLCNGAADDLIQQKQAWIARQPATAAERRQRFHAIQVLNEKLRPEVAAVAAAARQRLADCESRLRQSAILLRRDFAACLYPEATLRPFLTKFLTYQ